jgi:hypothetical protein
MACHDSTSIRRLRYRDVGEVDYFLNPRSASHLHAFHTEIQADPYACNSTQELRRHEMSLPVET